MASYRDLLSEKEAQNCWIKAAIALNITKEGLQDLVEDVLTCVHQDIYSAVRTAKGLPVGATCAHCFTENVLQCPTHGKCTKPRNCRFHNIPQKQYVPCPNGICEGVRDEIIQHHIFMCPSWKNTNADKWCTSPWEIGKCFLPLMGYKDVSSVKDIDFNGLVSILMSCKDFQNKLSFNITTQPNLLTKIRDIGLNLRHSADLKVEDMDLLDIMFYLRTLLVDKAALANRPEARYAVEQLKQLQIHQFEISTEKERILMEEGRASSALLKGHGYSGNLDKEYRMDSDPRGLLLIINNKTFPKGTDDRHGTDVDRDNLKNLFLKLGFEVEVYDNLTAQAMKDNLEDMSKLSKLKDVNSLAVAILTHGSDDILSGTDDEDISVRDIYQIFTAENCPALHDKPKFFIVIACRGDIKDPGSLGHADNSQCTDIKDPGSLGHADNSQCTVSFDGNKINHIPAMKDFLLAYSTSPGYVSPRDEDNGSYFIQRFVEVFSEIADCDDVVSMLVEVNKRVSEMVEFGAEPIPCPQVMLIKKWYLNPPSSRYRHQPS